MSFYTKSYLLDLSERRVKQAKTFTNAVNENKYRSSFDIFLSHSYKDKKYITGLYLELTSKGYSVYVDWIIDPDFKRDNVTKTTVNKIRLRMKQSKSLIYATSENASNSKWMPWELGFLDGDKGRCAILPITDYQDDAFKGQEFLSVYPVVRKGSIYYDSDLDIQSGLYEMTKMKSWINY